MGSPRLPFRRAALPLVSRAPGGCRLLQRLLDERDGTSRAGHWLTPRAGADASPCRRAPSERSVDHSGGFAEGARVSHLRTARSIGIGLALGSCARVCKGLCAFAPRRPALSARQRSSARKEDQFKGKVRLGLRRVPRWADRLTRPRAGLMGRQHQCQPLGGVGVGSHSAVRR